jgi:2-iminobutanoate/2-iminopropanoate deaminase
MDNFLTLNNQRGIYLDVDKLVEEPIERVRQIFKNFSETLGQNKSDLSETVRLVVSVSDMNRDRPLINTVQKEIWGLEGPYPCRTIIEVDYLGDDFVEIDGVFRIPDTASSALEFLAPENAFTPTATWSLGVKADGYVFVSGMRGINPETETLVIGDAPRVRQAFQNMAIISEAGGTKITDAIGLVIYVTDEKYLKAVEMLQHRFWGGIPLPPVTVNIVRSLNDNDIVEIEGTFAIN